jgi:hypothetical protein
LRSRFRNGKRLQRADSLTADLLISSVITSVIMSAVGLLACAAPTRRELRVQPTEALRRVDVCLANLRDRAVPSQAEYLARNHQFIGRFDYPRQPPGGPR